MGDPSALIFVALAIAWAAYLIPRALEHHEESARTRGVEKFSGRMKVLARRDAVSRRRTELVADTNPAPRTEASDSAVPTVSAPTPPTATSAASAKPDASRTRTRTRASAAQRRRRVLALVLVGLAATSGVAVAGVIATTWIAAPAAVLVAWLVTCRVMVRGEQRRRAMVIHPSVRAIPEVTDPQGVRIDTDITMHPPTQHEVVGEVVEVETDDDTEVVAPRGPKPTWEPQPLTLPMYVSKAPAPRRSVMTIDLESTGVWTSGRTEADSELVRQSEETPEVPDEERRSS